MSENANLLNKVKHLEQTNAEKETTLGLLRKAKQAAEVEQSTLRKVCEMQREEVSELESRLSQVGSQVSELKAEVEIQTRELEEEHERALAELADRHGRDVIEKQGEFERERGGQERRMQDQQEEFERERTGLKERLHEVTSNEINLINKIKSLEAEEAYNRAEVERALSKERDHIEKQTELKYKVDLLESELGQARMMIDDQAAAAQTEQSLPEDVAKISEQQISIQKMGQDLARYKQELIEARAHKSASDDDLGNVKGQLETMQNQITSLSEEGNRLRRERDEIGSELVLMRGERDHLGQLVTKMESSSDQDERNKAQIDDLREQVAKCEGAIAEKSEEVLAEKRSCRQKDEIIQQREIEISCLRGQVHNLTEEKNTLSDQSFDVATTQEENCRLLANLERLQSDSDGAAGEKNRLRDELKQQQMLYNELKKMRGRADDMAIIEEMYQELNDAKQNIQYKENVIKELSISQEELIEEISQLKYHQNLSNPTTQSSIKQSNNILHGKSAGEVALIPVGSLRVYEVMLGLCFVSIMLNWIFM